LAQVATLYYEDDLNQDEIASRMGISRSTVSRVLQEAREKGVVEITVHYPWKTAADLGADLAARFDLRAARVLASGGRPYDEILRGIGILAARYLESVLTAGSVLGVSWGQAVYHAVRALRSDCRLPVTVVQLVGAVGEGDPLIDGPDLARLLAGVYGGETRLLHAPLLVEDAQARDILLQEPRIQEILTLARQADLALVGIGAPMPGLYSMLRAGYLEPDDVADLRARGVVGDICARHYDRWGRLLDIELNRRVVGIDLADLQSVDQVVGVAGGADKAEAILGARRGGHVDVLVTDDTAADEILALADSPQVQQEMET
jgi:DNA-binding transcriptional regulator LsrR (DeoR family)